MKVFNTTGVCVPEKHYMVNIENRLKKIKKLVDDESYFVINKARQYGKTTTLRALNQYLKNDYHVVFMDFQTFSNTDFSAENIFSTSFAMEFTELFDHNDYEENTKLKSALKKLEMESESERFTLRPLFKNLRQICAVADKPVVLLIDEIDSATNNQVFLDFLAQLRAMYLVRDMQPAFQSVIFAGVYDIKNLKQKIHSEEDHKYNSPWNIAADFNIDMSFSKEEISGMLREYENDHDSGMDIESMSKLIFDYTDGYPFLVSRICQLIDASVYQRIEDKKLAWTKNGFNEAVCLILSEKNTLFESLIGKLHDYPELSKLIKGILFTGKSYPYNTDESVIDMAAMFGFIKNQNGNVAVANRIFEIRLYNFFLSEDELRENDIYRASLQDKNQFIVDGCLDIRKEQMIMDLKNYSTGVQHIGIPTNDIEKTVEFYHKLGFETAFETVNEEANERVVFLKLGTLVVETYENHAAKMEHGAIDHVALDVRDIEEIFQYINEAGLNSTQDTIHFLPFWENGVKFFTIEGPNKEKVEFSQYL